MGHREHYGSFALRGLQTQERLKPADIYRSKPEIAAGMIRELKAMGFRFKLVLADSLYGESGCGFINVLYELKLDFVVAIRSNHAVWLPREQTVRCNRWRKFKRVFSDGKTSFVIFENYFWQAPHSTILGTDHRPRDVAKECNGV